MPTQPINVIQEPLTPEQLSEELAKLQKLLRYLLNGQLDFENVRARSIKAENIEVGTLTAEEIAANTITAEKMNVTELSAISANLGHITAGLIEAINIIGSIITGSLIQTRAEGQYPRSFIASNGDFFGIQGSPTDRMTVIPGFGNRPTLSFETNSATTILTQNNSTFSFSSSNQMSISTTFGAININAPGGVYANGIRIDVVPPPPITP